MKRAVVVALATAMLISGCGNSTEQSTVTNNSVPATFSSSDENVAGEVETDEVNEEEVSEVASTDNDTEAESVSTDSSTDSSTVTKTITAALQTGISFEDGVGKTQQSVGDFPETVLVDDETVKVTLNKVYLDENSECLVDVTVENRTDTDIDVAIDDITVNGCMIHFTWVSQNELYNIPAGGTDTYTGYIYTDETDAYDITEVMSIEFSVEVYDEANYGSELGKYTNLKVEATNADSYEAPVIDAGAEIYNSDNVRVVLKGIDRNPDFNDNSLVFYVENKTDEMLYVVMDKFIVDGAEQVVIPFGWMIPGSVLVEEGMIDYSESDPENMVFHMTVSSVDPEDILKQTVIDDSELIEVTFE